MRTTFTKGFTTACAAAVLAVVPCHRLAAQLVDFAPFHWAYSPSLGGGVYRLGDDTEARVYRGNFSVKLRETPEAQGSGPGVRLLLPVTVGFQNLDDDDLPADRPSDEVETVGFLPGVELEQRVGERWTLRTRAQLGQAEELQGSKQSARLAAVGVRGRVAFDGLAGNPALITGLLWTGFDPSEGERRSLLRVTAGVEFDLRAARWQVRDSPMHWRPHVLKDWFYRPPSAIAFGDDDLRRLDEEWQLGVAAGREDGFKILFWKVEAVGIAYRFSEHSNGWRVYLNSAF